VENAFSSPDITLCTELIAALQQQMTAIEQALEKARRG